MKQITINSNNEPYYSEDFIKGFNCGAQRQFEADKADRPQGEWIYCEDYVGHDGYECSNCGFFIPWAYDCYTDSNFILNYHTCPYCGAKMGGEREGEV